MEIVDLFTYDKDLADIILGEYPGLIFEKQYHIDESNGEGKVHCFLDLNYTELFRFLPKYREKYEFEIHKKNGEFLEVNRIKKKD